MGWHTLLQGRNLPMWQPKACQPSSKDCKPSFGAPVTFEDIRRALHVGHGTLFEQTTVRYRYDTDSQSSGSFDEGNSQRAESSSSRTTPLSTPKLRRGSCPTDTHRTQSLTGVSTSARLGTSLPQDIPSPKARSALRNDHSTGTPLPWGCIAAKDVKDRQEMDDISSGNADDKHLSLGQGPLGRSPQACSGACDALASSELIFDME
mmetsp:Transcript_43930/g.95983  ORF Transcript_43930/g.95983 Transcript_43930/m.95983 type:complete len:206 (+) Transcript_43930:185-802(+)|eukprot:6212247-Pleurochrysis_carterae.AAC.2